MDEVYDIQLGSRSVGTARVIKQGLYYHFDCKCKLSGEVIYKVIASSGDNRVSLGVCVPRDGSFGLETRLPVKRLGEGDLSFRAVPSHAEVEGTFVPISPQEPFSYIDKLQKAYLEARSGQIGVVIKD